MPYTIAQTRAASISGDYKPTTIDAAKANADFRLVAVIGRKTAIIWRDGRNETVTDVQLRKLQAAQAWACDF